LTDIDNWFKVTNLFSKKNLKVALNGHEHENKISAFYNVPTAMTRSTLAKNNDSWGFTIVENSDSLIYFFEVEKDSNFKNWGEIDKSNSFIIPGIDSSEFINYGAEIYLNLNLETTFVAPPVFHNDYLYSADINGIITCFDTTGAVVWDYDAFGNIYSQPAIVENYFIVGTAQGDLITLDAQSGEQLQSIGFDEGITSQLITYDYTGSKSLIFPKNSSSKACVVLGTSSGKMYCYDVETLQEYWVFEKPNGMIETKPLHIENKIIFGCWDSKVYCIDDRNGLLIWEWNDIKNFYYAPAACWAVEDGKKVYFVSPNKYVYAIDIALGVTSWKKDNYDAWESIGISNDSKLLFVKGIEDRFHIVSSKTTNRVKLVKFRFGQDTMPGVIIDFNNRAIFNGQNGNIYSVDRKYNSNSLLFMGASRTLTVQKAGEDKLLAANMDGRITIFSIK
jgi:outer membrane protein assembly factor BamB